MTHQPLPSLPDSIAPALPADVPVVRLAAEAMHTRFEILLCDPDSSPEDLRAAGEEALDEIHAVEEWLSVYKDDALLFAVNAVAAKHPLRVDARLFAFLQRAAELSEATRGAFDPTVGSLRELWMSGGSAGSLPPDEDITAALSRVGMKHVVVLNADAQTVAFDLPGVRLDPGAIGKGYALNRAADRLRDAGIKSALLHGGTSSVVALGTPPNQQDGWRVAIQHPRNPQERLAPLLLQNQALGVSALHGRTFYATPERRFGHVLDPRTGWPVTRHLLAMVVSASATVADAFSTALLVDGSPPLEAPGSYLYDDRFAVEHALLIEVTGESDGEIRVHRYPPVVT